MTSLKIHLNYLPNTNIVQALTNKLRVSKLQFTIHSVHNHPSSIYIKNITNDKVDSIKQWCLKHNQDPALNVSLESKNNIQIIIWQSSL